MASFNKVILMGNMTRDPEVRYTPKGTAVCNISLAVNRVWTNEAGEKKEEVTFVECSAFGRTAENVGQYMRKGSPIMIEGRLRLEQWDDKQTGQKRQKLSVVVETCQFLNSGKREDGGGESQERRAAPAPTAREQVRQAAAASDNDGPPPDDDVPF